jgi:hypothetical protein
LGTHIRFLGPFCCVNLARPEENFGDVDRKGNYNQHVKCVHPKQQPRYGAGIPKCPHFPLLSLSLSSSELVGSKCVGLSSFVAAKKELF